MSGAQGVREVFACIAGLLIGLYFLLSYFGEKIIFTTLLMHDLKYTGFLIAVGATLNIIAPSKKWPAVFTSIPLAGASLYLCIGSVVFAVLEELPSHIVSAACFSLSSLAAYLLTIGLLKSWQLFRPNL